MAGHALSNVLGFAEYLDSSIQLICRVKADSFEMRIGEPQPSDLASVPHELKGYSSNYVGHVTDPDAVITKIRLSAFSEYRIAEAYILSTGTKEVAYALV